MDRKSIERQDLDRAHTIGAAPISGKDITTTEVIPKEQGVQASHQSPQELTLGRGAPIAPGFKISGSRIWNIQNVTVGADRSSASSHRWREGEGQRWHRSAISIFPQFFHK